MDTSFENIKAALKTAKVEVLGDAELSKVGEKNEKVRVCKQNKYQRNYTKLFNWTASILIYVLVISDYLLHQKEDLSIDHSSDNLLETFSSCNQMR